MIRYLLKMERHLINPTWYKISLKQNWNVVSFVPKNGLHPHLMYVHWIIFIVILLSDSSKSRKDDFENRLHQKLNWRKK